MKVVIYTGTEPTAHPQAGLLKPGENEIADDKLADRLIEAGRHTGDFLARDEYSETPAVEAQVEAPSRRRKASREEKE